MAQETFDYAALLADLRAKKAAIEEIISSVEKGQTLGALGQPGTGTIPTSVSTSSGPAFELPRGALMGLSVTEAIKLYLDSCKKKQTHREIANALKEHGVESTSKHFDVIVYNSLRSMKKAGTVLQFNDGWGLASLYPEGIRARMAKQKSKTKAPVRKRRKASKPEAVIHEISKVG